ncbi:MAG: hypothetical protein ACKVY0_22835 [Prosthecobacter sp.]|uniref:hypothetical protein n=1 Tax=Prosthecobacter sp. TaxID=1965333 RepID=UPI0038FFC36F
MSAGLNSIEKKRAADRQRVAEYLESQRPFTDKEWAAQLRLFEAVGRDTASALPFWKRWLSRWN